MKSAALKIINYLYRILAFTLIAIGIGVSLSLRHETFKQQQLKNERVKKAYEKKEVLLKDTFAKAGITLSAMQLYIRAYKEEGVMEIWAKNKTATTYKKVLEYNICDKSGQLGPKRKQGDGQVPEGFYHIDAFNPNGTYYLTMRVSYPNKSDWIKKTGTLPGGDICIHGKCVTIGCMPMTDSKIMEIYLLCVEAYNAGQAKIPVHIFPSRNWNKILRDDEYSNTLKDFWRNIKIGHDTFEHTKSNFIYSVDAKGNYVY